MKYISPWIRFKGEKKGNKHLKGEKEIGKIRNRICYFVCAVFTLMTVYI